MHYDNEGSDEGQFVEVAAPYGSDVSGLALDFYEADGTIYQSKSMTEFAEGETASGLTFWSLQLDSMLNGPNGIALVNEAAVASTRNFDDSEVVIEFISYGGTILATEGHASGFTSIDIGVQEMTEDDPTPVGFSLQKGGEGCSGADFVWQASSFARTPGSNNEGMSVTCPDGIDTTAPPTATPVCTISVVTMEEVAAHNTPEDVWVVLFGTVYDLTEYAPEHKGTPEVIYNIAGTDGTQEFNAALLEDHHHTQGKLYRTFRDDIVAIVGEESDEVVIECDEELRTYSPFTEFAPPADDEEPAEEPAEEPVSASPVASPETNAPSAVRDTPSTDSLPIFISEMHYDNEGSDEDQLIEVAVPYGTDVLGLILEFYNDDGTVYQTEGMVDFVHGSTVGGLTFYYKELDSMLNGPNGVALVDAAAALDPDGGTVEVLEFLSYGGTIVATEGLASGFTSVDIGVEENSDEYPTPVGFSLQKGGEGCSGDEFVWQAESFASTAGADNAGMTITCGGIDTTAPPTATPICKISVVTMEEVAEHDTPEDLWIALFGTVYDFTEYAPEHKGTPEVMYNIAGTDGTEQFNAALELDHHHTEGKLYRTFREDIVAIVGEESGEILIECDEELRDYSPYTSQ